MSNNNGEGAQFKRYSTRHMEAAHLVRAKLIAFNTNMTVEKVVNESLRIGLPAREAQEKAKARIEGRLWNGTGGGQYDGSA